MAAPEQVNPAYGANAYLATDPAGTQTLLVFDDADRKTSQIENYLAASSSSSGTTKGTGPFISRRPEYPSPAVRN